MRPYLLIICLTGCLHAQPTPLPTAGPLNRPLLVAIESALQVWDGGTALDLLIRDLQPELRGGVLATVRHCASDPGSTTGSVRVSARKWLAVKGYK